MAGFAETNLSQSASVVIPAASPTAEYHPPAWPHPAMKARSIVDSPSEIVRRHCAAWPGLLVETVEVLRYKPFEYRFRAPCHLLIAAELAEPYEDGETFVEGLPRSTLRDFTRNLTFVPAGHDFRGSQKPRALTCTTYFYIDPGGPLADPALRFEEIDFKPRLFFYDRDLWQTALKFKSLIENPASMPRQYAEALGIVLTHELVRINGDTARRSPVRRGGLAGWQQKRVAAHIEEHVADAIPLATLAELARLSPYHFSRSFKRSFGMPPHRYHANRRIERAKQLLANRELSIATIALGIGFGETSTFTAAFHRLTGQTPSRYRRNLE
jgi:AraC family transcriptional regulator